MEIENLTGGYGDTNVIFGLSARVHAGQVLGVFGRNGVGKTTLARLIQGSLSPASGGIVFRGKDIAALKAYQRRAIGIGYMPQTNMVFNDLTVLENLCIGNPSRPFEPYFDRFPRLAERLDQAAGTMSGGERKILAFVRTMLEDTDMIILDEPSEGVQPENIGLMAQCLRERVEAGAGAFLCEQNLSFLTEVADHYLGIDQGKAIIDRSAADISPQEVRSALSL
ncbi:MAG: ATP-binding cassette domain-containing protein [Ascidiaceihabitans sp.]|uniref:ABC transporter ATP-binding protein n=1 Tax=Ascidiaceihabitans sp. TaxID=1872644 RepID=UPI003296E783